MHAYAYMQRAENHSPIMRCPMLCAHVVAQYTGYEVHSPKKNTETGSATCSLTYPFHEFELLIESDHVHYSGMQLAMLSDDVKETVSEQRSKL